MKEKTLEDECREYKPDIELAGSGEKDLGHSLAERVIRKEGLTPINPDKEHVQTRKPIKEIKCEIFQVTLFKQMLLLIFYLKCHHHLNSFWIGIMKNHKILPLRKDLYFHLLLMR